MALSPNNNAALLQEVDEAVRKDQLDNIMQNYGRWILGAVVAGLLAFGGYLYWGHRQDQARGEKAEAMIAAFEKAASQPTAAVAELKKLEDAGNPAYRAASLMQQANVKAQANDLKGAAALMAQVASDTKLDQSIRDLALLRQTAFEYDTLKPDAVIARLKPIVDAKDPVSSWFPTAAEMSATAYYQLGQYDRAGALYGQIARMKNVGRGLQSRSVQMAGMLGVDAVVDRASEAPTENQKGTPGAAAAAKTEEAK